MKPSSPSCFSSYLTCSEPAIVSPILQKGGKLACPTPIIYSQAIVNEHCLPLYISTDQPLTQPVWPHLHPHPEDSDYAQYAEDID